MIHFYRREQGKQNRMDLLFIVFHFIHWYNKINFNVCLSLLPSERSFMTSRQTDPIEWRDFKMFFDHFEYYDVQATRRESKAEGKAEDVLSILEDLGRVPDNLRTRILEEQDLDLLTTWVKGSARAASVEEFIMKYLPELKES